MSRTPKDVVWKEMEEMRDQQRNQESDTPQDTDKPKSTFDGHTVEDDLDHFHNNAKIAAGDLLGSYHMLTGVRSALGFASRDADSTDPLLLEKLCIECAAAAKNGSHQIDAMIKAFKFTRKLIASQEKSIEALRKSLRQVLEANEKDLADLTRQCKELKESLRLHRAQLGDKSASLAEYEFTFSDISALEKRIEELRSRKDTTCAPPIGSDQSIDK